MDYLIRHVSIARACFCSLLSLSPFLFSFSLTFALFPFLSSQTLSSFAVLLSSLAPVISYYFQQTTETRITDKRHNHKNSLANGISPVTFGNVINTNMIVKNVVFGNVMYACCFYFVWFEMKFVVHRLHVWQPNTTNNNICC